VLGSTLKAPEADANPRSNEGEVKLSKNLTEPSVGLIGKFKIFSVSFHPKIKNFSGGLGYKRLRNSEKI